MREPDQEEMCKWIEAVERCMSVRGDWEFDKELMAREVEEEKSKRECKRVKV